MRFKIVLSLSKASLLHHIYDTLILSHICLFFIMLFYLLIFMIIFTSFRARHSSCLFPSPPSSTFYSYSIRVPLPFLFSYTYIFIQSRSFMCDKLRFCYTLILVGPLKHFVIIKKTFSKFNDENKYLILKVVFLSLSFANIVRFYFSSLLKSFMIRLFCLSTLSIILDVL